MDGIEQDGRIGSVNIPTCDRPEQLPATIASWIEHNSTHSRAAHLNIIDDSRSPGMQYKNENVVRYFRSKYGEGVSYLGRTDRLRIAQEVGRHAGVDDEIVRFALLGDGVGCGPSYGAPRNAILLHTAGEPCLQSDDDILASAYAPPGAGGELETLSGSDANDYWFCAGQTEAERSVIRAGVDLLAEHERFLGRPLGKCLTSSARGVAKASPGKEASEEDRQEPIVASFAGTWGDSGMASHYYRLFESGATRRRLVEDAALYPGRLRTPYIVKCPVRPRLSQGPYFMAGHVALDNRELLPPFLPVHLGEDVVFGSVLGQCLPDTYRAYLPFAVPHLPGRSRIPCPGVVSPGEFVRTGRLLFRLIRSHHPPSSAGTASRMQSLGGFLIQLGESHPSTFQERVRLACSESLKGMAETARRLLDEHSGEPAHWRRDVLAFIRTAGRTAELPSIASPSDLPGDVRNRQALFQEITLQYGRLLECWPAMVESAKKLRCKDYALAA